LRRGGSSTRPASVYALTTNDVGSPEWASRLRRSSAPVVVVGSGKTAMDTILALGNSCGDRSRIRCIVVRGSWFFDRAVLNGEEGPSLIFGVLDMYDGTNAAEVYAEFARRRLFHSVVPAPFSFLSATASREELDEVRRILRLSAIPDESSAGGGRLVRAHLLDIEGGGGDSDGDGGTPSDSHLVLRDCDDAAVRRVRVPPGTFVVDCTDGVALSADDYLPVVSPDGLVLSPQAACGFSGPSTHLLTHLWYLGRIDPLWRALPRIDFDRRKDKLGIAIQMLVVLMAGTVGAALTREVRRGTKALPKGRRGRNGGTEELRRRTLSSLPALVAKMQRIMPLRYDDEKFAATSRNGDCKFLPGRIGSTALTATDKCDGGTVERGLKARGTVRQAKL